MKVPPSYLVSKELGCLWSSLRQIPLRLWDFSYLTVVLAVALQGYFLSQLQLDRQSSFLSLSSSSVRPFQKGGMSYKLFGVAEFFEHSHPWASLPFCLSHFSSFSYPTQTLGFSIVLNFLTVSQISLFSLHSDPCSIIWLLPEGPAVKTLVLIAHILQFNLLLVYTNFTDGKWVLLTKYTQTLWHIH